MMHVMIVQTSSLATDMATAVALIVKYTIEVRRRRMVVASSLFSECAALCTKKHFHFPAAHAANSAPC